MNDPQTTRPSGLPPQLGDMLVSLRRRIRLYVGIEGLAIVLATVGVAFWLGLALDWTFEPSPAVRSVLLVAVFLIAAWIAFRLIVRRLSTRMGSSSLAVLVERHFSQFQDSLITSVELSDRPQSTNPLYHEMLQHTSQEALAASADVRLAEVFNWRPLWRSVILAVALIASVALFGLLSSDAFGFWMRRISLSEELWPRRTRLVIEGFPAGDDGIRRAKVARAAPLDLVVKADTRKPYVPDVVTIRYRTADGRRGRETMTRIGRANPARDRYQTYSYTFENLSVPLSFDVIGGDWRERDLQIEVVERPQLTSMTADCTYPPYLQKAPEQLPVSTVVQIPEGTALTLRGSASKNLVRVDVDGGQPEEPISIDMTDAADPRQFQFSLPALTSDRVLLFTLLDTDGVTTLEPYRVSLRAVADEPPSVSVRLNGIGAAVTPNARIPVIGQITDDHGIDRVWFEYQIDDHAATSVAFDRPTAGTDEFDANQTLDLQKFPTDSRPQPKQRLIVTVQAADRYDLGQSPHVGSGPRFVLDVVSPEQLRILLQRRELLLRQRFESILEELTDTRDLVARIDFTDTAANDSNKGEAAKGETIEDETTENETDKEEMTTADATTAEATVPQWALSRRRLRVAHALQSIQRTAHETLSVSTGFDEIYGELVNNRLDTEELKTRLVDSISVPLADIGEHSFSQLEKQVRELEAHIADPQAGPSARAASVQQADALLVEMRAILTKMLELESYNEVLEQLKGIIETQEELHDRTQKLRRDKLRELLED